MCLGPRRDPPGSVYRGRAWGCLASLMPTTQPHSCLPSGALPEPQHGLGCGPSSPWIQSGTGSCPEHRCVMCHSGGHGSICYCKVAQAPHWVSQTMRREAFYREVSTGRGRRSVWTQHKTQHGPRRQIEIQRTDGCVQPTARCPLAIT